MCGICGIVNFDSSNHTDRTSVAAMAEVMKHRGPDDDGYFIAGNAGLGHRRLSIIDLSGGRQPIFNEDESILVIANGEIYNYRELTRELVSRGHRFRTESDSEVILHAYEEYGEDCVERLQGMFAFAVWDRRRHRLFLARDRLGIKPLYYHRSPEFLAFASEIKSLLTLEGIPRVVDPEALDLYLSLRYVPGPRTMFDKIHKLQPGHTLLVEDGDVRIRRYWDLEDDPEPLPVDEGRERFAALLRETVDSHLMSDVPLGVFLSGGLDSSAILAEMSALSADGTVSAFSIGYPGGADDERSANELGHARRVARHFGAAHHEFRLRPGEFGDFLDEMVWYLDEPLADPTCVPLYFLSRMAREHVTVVLSGEGADETLAGYGIYRRMLALDGLYQRFPGVCSRLAPLAARLTPWEKPSWYLRALGEPLSRRYTGVSRNVVPQLKARLLGEPAAGGTGTLLRDRLADEYSRVEEAGPLERMLYLDTKVWLPDDLLLKADRMTMANGMELRVPFLDHRLVELCWRLPQELKMGDGQGKAVLRQTVGQRLPPFVVRREKQGFPVPMQSWLHDHLRQLVHQRLLTPNAACNQHMDPQVVAALVAQHERGEADRSQELWSLMVFEAWHQTFIEGRLPVSSGTRQPARSIA